MHICIFNYWINKIKKLQVLIFNIITYFLFYFDRFKRKWRCDIKKLDAETRQSSITAHSERRTELSWPELHIQRVKTRLYAGLLQHFIRLSSGFCPALMWPTGGQLMLQVIFTAAHREAVCMRFLLESASSVVTSEVEREHLYGKPF